MEAAGLVVGIVALVGVFENCITLLSQIATAKTIAQDYTRLETKLDFQKLFLLQWATRLQLFKELYDKRLDDPIINSMVARGLYCIRDLFLNSEELQRRYGCRHVKEDEEVSSFSAVSDRLMVHYHEGLVALRSRQNIMLCEPSKGKAKTTKYSNLTKVKWVVRDKEKFQILVQELSELVTNLERILPAQEGDKSSRNVLKEEIHSLHDIGMLKRVLHASTDDNADLVEVAEDAITQNCYGMILNQLWFRLIDDRKNSIADEHPETLEWAIHPPSGKRTWNDLSEWFRQGYGIYWISGKPGSGKSTLMKYLLTHPDVISMLKQWAGDLDLTVASFFIWNIGSVEQNSQQGLARGLLYHVLKQNKLLIPIILPGMWQEAQNGNSQLNLPSKSEMTEAFRKLGHESKSGAYAFFIDGIDEFSGNYREGISFLQKLAESSNIKLLVSSRPIDVCEAAFSSKPKLALQDLTEHDIDVYVTDIIRSQPYVIEKMLEEDVVSHLIEDLRKKAEGVFLWVVLACRTLIDGFQAYDNPSELQRRVEELPPELEDLFRHILSKIPPRFLSHTAKLLRVCWTIHQFPMEFTSKGDLWISALGLSCVDEHEFRIYALNTFTKCSLEEKRRKLSRLKGRLTSRCMGLLEIYGISRGIETMQDFESHTIYVEFMHRTVFEFLSTPGVWDMPCLDIHDQNFDAITILFFIAANALYLQVIPLNYDFTLIRQILDYLKVLNYRGSINLPYTVKSLTSVFMHLICAPTGDQRSRSIINLYKDKHHEYSPDGSLSSSQINKITKPKKPSDINQQSLPLDHATLLIAIDFGLNSYVSEHQINSFQEAQTQSLHPLLQYPLLYHTFSHLLSIQLPFFVENSGCLMLDRMHIIASPFQAIRELLNHGCSPNEIFSNDRGRTTTPFLAWIDCCYQKKNGRMLLRKGYAFQFAEITLMMLQAGGNFEPLNPEGSEISKARDYRATLIRSINLWLSIKTEEADKDKHTKLVECCNKIKQAIAEKV